MYTPNRILIKNGLNVYSVHMFLRTVKLGRGVETLVTSEPRNIEIFLFFPVLLLYGLLNILLKDLLLDWVDQSQLDGHPKETRTTVNIPSFFHKI